jgi:lysophospholipase L1-like esterase
VEQLRFIERDDRLGWKATANYQVRYRVRSGDGAEQTVTYSSVENGFRVWGEVNTTRPKVLFIGDSFTQAVNIPTDKTYAALLSKALQVEVFSYGGGAFGTLQELMVLEDVIDRINPDVVVLQFCSNDFINNSFELESKSTINNLRWVRPYLSPSGEIVYRNPVFTSAFLSDLWQTSRLFNSLARRLYLPLGESVEGVIARNPGDREFRESVAVTRTLLDRFKHKVGNGRKLLVFTADGARTRMVTLPEEYQAYAGVAEQALVRILNTLQIPFIAGVPDALVDREAKGAVVKDSDGAHWNELGHKLVAEELQKSAAFTRIFAKAGTDIEHDRGR